MRKIKVPLFLILLLASLWSDGHAVLPPTPKDGGRPLQNAEQIAAKLAANVLAGDFQSSFAAREAIDFLLTPAFLVQDAFFNQGERPESADGKAENIQFDANFELNPLGDQRYAYLAVRYWVGPGFYQLAISWTEPSMPGLPTPAGLSVQSSPEGFRITHDTIARFNGNYSKPAVRPLFMYRYGDYPIDNLRFADQEATAESLRFGGLRLLTYPGNPHQTKSLLSRFEGRMKVANVVANLQAGPRTNHILAFDLFDADDRLLRHVDYEYDPGESGELRREDVFLPEQRILVAFRNDGATVKLGKTEYRVREFPLVYRQGGRKYSVKYAPVPISKRMATIPVSVEIRNGRGDKRLHSVRLSGFHLARVAAEKVGMEVEQFRNLDGIRERYNHSLKKYRDGITNLSNADALEIDALIRQLDRFRDSKKNSVGEELALTTMLIELNRLAGYQADALAGWERYWSFLAEHQMYHPLLISGVSAIQNAAKRRRHHEENLLLNRWLDTVFRAVDPDSALRFAANQLDRKNFIVSMKLLEKFNTRWESPDQRFEKAAIYCLGAHSLVLLLKTEATGEKDPSIGQPARWVLVHREQLVQSEAEAFREFELFLGKVGPLTSFQSALKARVDKAFGSSSVSQPEPFSSGTIKNGF